MLDNAVLYFYKDMNATSPLDSVVVLGRKVGVGVKGDNQFCFFVSQVCA